jgi:AcrR family transcriptional regulator
MSVQTRGRLLEAAKKIFSERGYYNTRISHIIDEAGVARGTFYLYFRSKEEIFRELLKEVVEELKARIRVIDLSGDPVEQVRENIERVIELALEERELARIVLQRNCDPELFKITDSFFEEVCGLIKGSLDKGIALGLIRPCNTEVVARGIMGALKEIIVGVLDKEDVDPKEIAREVLDFGIRGVWSG